MSLQSKTRARTPWFEQILILGSMVFVAFIAAVMVGAAFESKVSPVTTAVVLILGLIVSGVVLVYDVRVLRSGVTVSQTAVTVATPTRTRRLDRAAVEGFVLDPNRRHCVVKLRSGEEVFCPTLGYGPGAPRSVRERATAQVERLNAALSR